MSTQKFRAAFLTLTVAALVTVPAAVAQTASEETSETPAAVSQRTTVRVVNNNWQDIRVYAVRGIYRRRLGTVTSLSSSVFTLPPTFLVQSEELRLMADPIGRRGTFVSEVLVVNPGDVVEWRLWNNIELSNIFIHRFRIEDL